MPQLLQGDARRRWKRLLRDRRARVAVIVLVIVTFSAIFAPVLAPYDPTAQLDIVRLQNQAPSFAARHFSGAPQPFE